MAEDFYDSMQYLQDIHLPIAIKTIIPRKLNSYLALSPHYFVVRISNSMVFAESLLKLPQHGKILGNRCAGRANVNASADAKLPPIAQLLRGSCSIVLAQFGHLVHLARQWPCAAPNKIWDYVIMVANSLDELIII
jgi:hypothetical protein